MRARTLASVLLVGLFSLGLVRGASGQTGPPTTQHYELTSESRFETGCFGPCACPVIFTNPIKGTFDLRHVGFDGLYDVYDVLNVRWTVPDTTSNITIQGSGTYRVGGEVAVQHQMKLDVTVGGGAPLHFDSGLVSGGGSFPRITIDVSLHQNTACRDTVMHVDATDPVTGVDPSPSAMRVLLEPVSSNPFSGAVFLRLELPRAARVSMFVYDIQGRVVRHLSRDTMLAPGTHPIMWDGRRDDGRATSSGVYFVSVGVVSQRVSCRVVKAQ